MTILRIDWPWIDFLDAKSKPDSDVLNGLIVLRDDANTLGNRFGRDGVISSDHDDLDAGRAALGDGVRHRSTRRVYHGHQTDEPQTRQRKVLGVRVERIADRIPTYCMYRQHVAYSNQIVQSSRSVNLKSRDGRILG